MDQRALIIPTTYLHKLKDVQHYNESAQTMEFQILLSSNYYLNYN